MGRVEPSPGGVQGVGTWLKQAGRQARQGGKVWGSGRGGRKAWAGGGTGENGRQKAAGRCKQQHATATVWQVKGNREKGAATGRHRQQGQGQCRQGK